VFEITDLTFRVRQQTPGYVTILIILGNFTRITCSIADTVERSRAAMFQAVLVAVLTDPVVVGVLGDRTLRHAVRTILHILTA